MEFLQSLQGRVGHTDILQDISTQDKSTHSEMPGFLVVDVLIKTGSVNIKLKLEATYCQQALRGQPVFSMKRDS